MMNITINILDSETISIIKEKTAYANGFNNHPQQIAFVAVSTFLSDIFDFLGTNGIVVDCEHETIEACHMSFDFSNPEMVLLDVYDLADLNDHEMNPCQTIQAFELFQQLLRHAVLNLVSQGINIVLNGHVVTLDNPADFIYKPTNIHNEDFPNGTGAVESVFRILTPGRNELPELADHESDLVMNLMIMHETDGADAEYEDQEFAGSNLSMYSEMHATDSLGRIVFGEGSINNLF